MAVRSDQQHRHVGLGKDRDQTAEGKGDQYRLDRRDRRNGRGQATVYASDCQRAEHELQQRQCKGEP
jgi:hypothetical protein